jgi:hypothetical protein
MQILQTARKKPSISVPVVVSAACFCSESGTLLYATNQIFKWQLKEDKQTRIMIEQQNQVAHDYLNQYKKGLQDCGVVSKEDTHDIVEQP